MLQLESKQKVVKTVLHLRGHNWFTSKCVKIKISEWNIQTCKSIYHSEYNACIIVCIFYILLVADVTDSLGGLAMPESSNGKLDLTPLVANVTRLYGATPFFRVIVHAPRKISVSYLFISLLLCRHVCQPVLLYR